MVITVTLNPALDKTLIIDNFKLGDVNRVIGVRYDIGGKGINVSKVLKNLDIDSLATGFLGGIFKDTFERELDKRKISHHFITINGDVRTNVKIIDNKNKLYTDINEAGPNITSEELNSFISFYSNQCQKGDLVVLSGGIPIGIPKDIYGTLTRIAKEKGALVILDAEGSFLDEGIKEKPFAIKPNIYELSLLYGMKPEEVDEKKIIKGAISIKKKGVNSILISMGSLGAVYVTDNGIYTSKALKVPVKNTVGAGDSMVAALVYSLINNLDDMDTLSFAQACGGATVSLEGTKACTKEQVEELLPQSKKNVRRV